MGHLSLTHQMNPCLHENDENVSRPYTCSSLTQGTTATNGQSFSRSFPTTHGGEKRIACTNKRTPVFEKTDEALSYLKVEHEAKLELIALQKETAVMKKRAYEDKMKYYQEKRRKLVIDL